MKIIFFYYYYDDKIKDKRRVEFPPLGMLHLCSSLEKIGCDVKVKYFDERTRIEDIPNADIYAYSISSTASYPTYLQLAEKLKEKATYHIAGNTQATIFPEQVLKQMNLDVVFTGEGEKTVTDWIKNDCKEKGIIKGERVDITDLPFPARHLIPDDKIYMNNRVGGKKLNWTDYTIYDNNNHWWGTETDYNNMNLGYGIVEKCVKSINNKEYKKELEEER